MTTDELRYNAHVLLRSDDLSMDILSQAKLSSLSRSPSVETARHLPIKPSCFAKVT